MPETFWVGTWLVEPLRGRLRSDRGHVRIEPRVMSLLVRLSQTPSQAVSREELIADVWAGAFVTDEVLSSAVRKLRKALGDDVKAPDYIQTLPGFGYRLVAMVERSRQAPEPRPWRPLLRLRWILPIVLVMASVVVFAVSIRVPGSAASVVTRSPATSLPGLEKDPALSPDGRLLAFTWDGGNEAALPQLLSVVDGENEPRRLTMGAGDVQLPRWSPDATSIAFIQHVDPVHGGPISVATEIPGAAHAIYVAPLLGGTPRLVGKTGFSGSHALDWSPDGKSLVLVDRQDPGGPDSLFLLSVEDGSRRQITFPPTPRDEDGQAAFSPDGRKLAFIRAKSPYGRHGDVFVLNFDAADSKPKPAATGLDASDLEWGSDGRSLAVVSRNEGGSLWHVDVETEGRSKSPYGAGSHQLSLSADGRRVAYGQRSSSFAIWRASGPQSIARTPPVEFIRSTHVDTEPEYSPNGRRIAFQSSRTGESRLFVADADGNNAMRLTSFRTDGVPRWSHGGAHLLFEGYKDPNQADIFSAATDGGALRQLTSTPSNEVDPIVSSDGSRIYFASDRSGSMEVWSMSPDGSNPRRLTSTGGRAPQPSHDGSLVYYAKASTSELRSTIWCVRSDGGEPWQVLRRRPHFKEWALWENNLVFVEQMEEGGPRIKLIILDTGAIRVLEELGPDARTSVGLSVSSDGEWLLFTRTFTGGDIILLDGSAGPVI